MEPLRAWQCGCVSCLSGVLQSSNDLKINQKLKAGVSRLAEQKEDDLHRAPGSAGIDGTNARRPGSRVEAVAHVFLIAPLNLVPRGPGRFTDCPQNSLERIHFFKKSYIWYMKKASFIICKITSLDNAPKNKNKNKNRLQQIKTQGEHQAFEK